MPPFRTTKAKTHLLKSTDLSSICEPADPNESAFTATKGTKGLATHRSITLSALHDEDTWICDLKMTPQDLDVLPIHQKQ